MANPVQLSSLAVGTVIRVPEKTKNAEYIVLDSLYSNASRQYRLVIRRYCAEKAQWAGWGRDSYDGSNLDVKCSSYIADFLSGTITGYIPTVPIEIRDIGASAKKTIQRRVFSLSQREVGYAPNATFPGTPIGYFNSNARRQAQDGANFNLQVWWLRDPVKNGLVSYAQRINTSGASDDAFQTDSYWYRPAFYLPTTMTVEVQSGGGYLAIPNTSPTRPAWVTAANTANTQASGAIVSGEPVTVSWAQASDLEQSAASLTYRVGRSYDGGLTWALIATTNGSTTAISDTIPYGVTTSVFYGVTAIDNFSQASDQAVTTQIQVISNTAPGAPLLISVSPAEKGATVTVTWSEAPDPENNVAGYALERSIDDGITWAEVFGGAARTYQETVGNWNTVTYRVRAYDSYGAYSPYNTADTVTVTEPVTISITVAADSAIQDGAVCTEDPDDVLLHYTISNTDDQTMENSYAARLTLDGDTILAQTNGVIEDGDYSVGLTKEGWQGILNGNHVLLLTVTDGQQNTAACAVTFAKDVAELRLITDPLPVELGDGQKLKNCMVNVTGSFPEGSTLNIYATNNALDDAPAWQRLNPGEYNTGVSVLLSNNDIVNGNAFALRIEASRGTASEPCFVDSIYGLAGQSYLVVLGGDASQLQEDLETEIAERQAGDEALQQQIDQIPRGLLQYQGEVDTFADLPADPGQWDCYKTTDTGVEWYWDGGAWDQLDFSFEFDSEPLPDSNNLVSSGVVAAALTQYATAQQLGDALAAETAARDDADADLQQQLNDGLATKQDVSPYTTLEVVHNALTVPGDIFHGRAVFVSGEAGAANLQIPTAHWANVQSPLGWVLYWRANPDQITATPFSVTFNVVDVTTGPNPTTTSYVGLASDTLANLGAPSNLGVTFADPDALAVKLVGATEDEGFPGNLYLLFSPQTVTEPGGNSYDLDAWQFYKRRGGGSLGGNRVQPGNPHNVYLGGDLGAPAPAGNLLVWFSSTGLTQEIVEAFFADFPAQTRLRQGLTVYDEHSGWLQGGETQARTG
ncbi:MAG: fibronectin type III domain-containing protein [Oscillospiraceae bacterium]|jgi:hypothetical protein|nr:fibronectin type III domain-containing protein [Oscillospiraceae bacterium]